MLCLWGGGHHLIVFENKHQMNWLLHFLTILSTITAPCVRSIHETFWHHEGLVSKFETFKVANEVHGCRLCSVIVNSLSRPPSFSLLLWMQIVANSFPVHVKQLFSESSPCHVTSTILVSFSYIQVHLPHKCFFLYVALLFNQYCLCVFQCLL